MSYLTRRHHRARHVRDLLRTEILDGRFVVESLPPEEVLAARFAVGRNVMRAALALLVDERLLRRIPGRGTSSTAHVVLHSLNSLRAINEDGESNVDGDTVHYRLLAWERVPAPAPVAEQLDLTTGEEVILWERLTMTREPIVLWTSYLRADRGFTSPALATRSFRGGTFSFFESFGLEIGSAHVRTGAARVDPGVAELLGVPVGEPTMVQHRRTVLVDGSPIETAVGYYRSDMIFLMNDFSRTPQN